MADISVKTVNVSIKLNYNGISNSADKRLIRTINSFGGVNLSRALLKIKCEEKYSYTTDYGKTFKEGTKTVLLDGADPYNEGLSTKKANSNGKFSFSVPSSATKIVGKLCLDERISNSVGDSIPVKFSPVNNSTLYINVTQDMLVYLATSVLWTKSLNDLGLSSKSLSLNFDRTRRSYSTAGSITIGKYDSDRDVNTISHEIGHALDFKCRGLSNAVYIKTWFDMLIGFADKSWDFKDYEGWNDDCNYSAMSSKNRKGVIFIETPSDFNGNMMALEDFKKNYSGNYIETIDNIFKKNYESVYGKDSLYTKIENVSSIYIANLTTAEKNKLKNILFISKKYCNYSGTDNLPVSTLEGYVVINAFKEETIVADIIGSVLKGVYSKKTAFEKIIKCKDWNDLRAAFPRIITLW